MHTEERSAVLNWINISVHYYNHYTLYMSYKFISIEFIKQSVCVIIHYRAVFVFLKNFFENLGSLPPLWVVRVRKGGNKQKFISIQHGKEVSK